MKPPVLGRQKTGELEEVQRCLPKPTTGDKSDSFHKNTPCPLSCCSHSKDTKVLGCVFFVTKIYTGFLCVFSKSSLNIQIMQLFTIVVKVFLHLFLFCY